MMHPQHDPLDFTRDEIQAEVDNVIAFADIVGRLAGVRDDTGCVYTFRKLLAHTRLLSECMKVVIAENNRLAHPTDAAERSGEAG